MQERKRFGGNERRGRKNAVEAFLRMVAETE